MQEVIKVNNATLKQMNSHYASNQQVPPVGALFRVKQGGTIITGYNSGKVMFQGTNVTSEVSKWGKPTTSTNKASFPKATNSTLPSGFDTWSVIGSDEVGTGSYFGPLTVASVYVTSENIETVRKLGIQDSKKLTDPEIVKMAKQLITFLPYHVVNIMPTKYNQMIEKYNQGQLKALCHNLALTNVLKKIQPEKPQAILIDQFVAPSTYYRYLKGQSIIHENVYFQTKGEQAHLAVAAASVIARYVSLEAMDELTANAGITLPIGAGNAVDQIAAKLIRQGKPLADYAKLHFANTQKAQAIADNK
ncbi:Ribonuclease HIII [Paucilactobacillus oligofermentans DSM 15707 = LMG 22743]|nr:ribonuclease HIII [Paucilactobacillus oligofermentans]CUS26552.1 Ribonuclease HIII [Paucilactobacillus oligofermentans DSM 15707 = LMG 22743]